MKSESKGLMTTRKNKGGQCHAQVEGLMRDIIEDTRRRKSRVMSEKKRICGKPVDVKAG